MQLQLTGHRHWHFTDFISLGRDPPIFTLTCYCFCRLSVLLPLLVSSLFLIFGDLLFFHATFWFWSYGLVGPNGIVIAQIIIPIYQNLHVWDLLLQLQIRTWNNIHCINVFQFEYIRIRIDKSWSVRPYFTHAKQARDYWS